MSTRSKLWKRIGSTLLVMAMILSLLPTTVFASGTLDGLYFSYKLYEYNPMIQETVRVSTGDEYSALGKAINAYDIYSTSKIPNAPIPEKVDVPGNNSDYVTTDETTGFPKVTYTYKDVEYTWLCTGYEVNNVVHPWTSDELAAGYSTDIDLSSKEGKSAFIYYCWTREGRRVEDSSSDYETITLTFDFWTIIKATNGAGGAPALTLPDGCDLTKADYKLYGSNSIDESLPSRIANNIKNGTIELITTGNEFVDGSLSVEWPKGYCVTFDDILKDQYGYDYYYITITDGGYVWYGDANSWNTISGVTSNPLQTLVPEKDTTLYAVYHSNYMPDYQPAEGYTLIYAGNYNDLVEDSKWSNTEFSQIQSSKITFPQCTWPNSYMAVPKEWSFTVAPPVADELDENGNVFVTDGTFTWQCVGVQYSLDLVNGPTTTLEHENWNNPLQIEIEDTSVLDPNGYGGTFFLIYLWKEVTFGEPPTMYDVKYEFQLPDELSTVSGRRVFPVKHSDDIWGSYDAWDLLDGDNDFSEYGLQRMQNEIKASDVTVREGTTLVILANAPDNHSGYQDFRDFLAFNNNEQIYYEFAGWEDENGVVHQIGTPVKVDDLSNGTDTTITLKATWTEIESISEEMYQEAADTLRLQVLSSDSSFASPVLVTQWTDTDPNEGANNKLTGNPMILNEDDTLYYKMSAKLNSGLFGSSDSQHITKGDCVELTFSLDVDPNLEFADSSQMTITYNNPNLELVSTNFGSVSGPDADNNYVVTVKEGSLPTNTDGGLHLTFTVKIINQPETQFNQQAGDPMEFSGFAFKLKDGVKMDGLVIESTANVTGHMDLDKISNTGYHHRFRYYHVRSFLQGDEAQALFGGATDPTAFVHAMQFIDRKLANYDLSQDKMSPVKANTVKAFGSALIITPADITIYMGGDGGYDAVVGTDGEIAPSTNSLPHPLFTIDAPNGVDPEGLTFTNGKTGEEEKTWKLVCDNPTSTGQKYYHFLEGTNQDKVRVTYTDENGTEHISDAFNPSAVHNVYTTYTIAIYPGDNDMNTITAKDTTGKVYAISANTGTLTVRAVADSDPTSDIVDVAPTEKIASETAVAVAPAGTTYTLNNTGAPLPPVASDTNPDGSKPSLLFDSIIDDAEHNRTGALENKANEKLGAVGSNTTRHYEIKYLDLVDANNGNAWITSSLGMDIYWGYPETTGQGTTFKLLHFKGLHRDDNGGNSGFDITDISNLNLENVEIINVTNTGTGIKFHVDAGGFSPFALVWETTSSGGTGTGTRDDYTLHYVTNGGKHLSSETKSSSWTKDYEDLPIPVRDGYTFEGWYWDLRLTEPVTGDVKVNKTTVTLYAKWSGSYDPDDTGVSKWLETNEHNAFLSGYPDGSFLADKNMTRAEVAQMFYSLLLDKDVKITKSFSDVPTDAWYAKAVNTLSSLGMLGGYPDGTFRPDAPITRAEFAAIALAFAYDSASASCPYTDVRSSAWYYTYVAQATTYGWIGGYPDGSFRPNNSITRAEVAVIVNNMLGRDADERYIDRNADELVSFVDLSKNHWAYYTIMEATNTHDYTTSSNGESWK